MTCEATQPDVRSAAQQLAACVEHGRPMLREFHSAAYEAAFRACMLELPPVLDALHETKAQTDLPQEDVLRAACAGALDVLAQGCTAGGRRVSARRRMEDKLVIAALLVPAVRKQADPLAEPLAQALHAVWMERYPKDPFLLGTYEDISGGFRPKNRLCFITTAVCRSEGKPDDCPELTAFRRYRDEWLARQPGGREQIARYYRVAPVLVTLIGLTEDADAFYAGLRGRYLAPCLRHIEAGEPEACRAVYTDMVETLCARYGVC